MVIPSNADVGGGVGVSGTCNIGGDVTGIGPRVCIFTLRGAMIVARSEDGRRLVVHNGGVIGGLLQVSYDGHRTCLLRSGPSGTRRCMGVGVASSISVGYS